MYSVLSIIYTKNIDIEVNKILNTTEMMFSTNDHSGSSLNTQLPSLSVLEMGSSVRYK